MRLDDKIDLANLPAAKGAAFDAYDNESEPTCHPETRQGLLRQIEDWADDPDGKCIFWLCGPAGTGKSTISRTVAGFLADRQQLAASFFFNRTRAGRNKADLFVTTVARQLTRRVPLVRNFIAEAIQAEPDLPEKGLQIQFDKLISEPLSKVKTDSAVVPTLVLVVDALDECDSVNLDGNSAHYDRTRQIVSLLAKFAMITSVKVRVFLTSRPEVPIQLGFKDDIPDHSLRDVALLRDIPTAVIEHDIPIFIAAQFRNTRKAYSISEEWPGEDIIDSLANIAMPLFIYASTICKFVNDPRRRLDPRNQLKKILSTNRGMLTNIRATYQPILEQVIDGLSDGDEEQMLKDFRTIVGSIILLADPLSASALGQLLGVQQELILFQLNNLHSVLDVPDDNEPSRPVQLFHLSFREYLLSQSEERSLFSIDERSKHSGLLHCCLETMLNRPGKDFCLRNDICQLDEPGVLRADVEPDVVQKHIPRHLQYACLHWVHHLEASRWQIHTGDEVDVFLNCHFVHWLEAMGWLGKMKESIESVLKLQDCIALSDSQPAAFLRDARRFVLKHRGVIEMAPCQVYSSAILFSPDNSIIKATFLPEVPTWVAKLPEAAHDWDPTVHVLDSESSPMGQCFSPDGQNVAIFSDKGVALWDTNTGNVMRGQKGDFCCVAYTSDNRIVCGTSGTVHVWDPVNDTMQNTNSHLGGRVDYVCTSSLGQVACALRNHRVCILDERLNIVHELSVPWDKNVYKLGLSFSPDGTLLCVGARNSSRLWLYDTTSGCCVKHFSSGQHLTFAYFAMSQDNVLVIYNQEIDFTQVFSHRPECKQHFGAISINGDSESSEPAMHPIEAGRGLGAVDFNANSGMLVYLDEQNNLYVWKGLSKSPYQVATLKLSSYCKSVCVSPDGKLILVISYEKTKIFDVGLLERYKGGINSLKNTIVAGPDDWVRWGSMTSSPDGSRFAVASNNGKVTVWGRSKKAKSGSITPIELASPHELAEFCSTALAWSPDGIYLAVSVETRLDIWKHIPGATSIEMTCSGSYSRSAHVSFVWSSATCFSPCGRFLAMSRSGAGCTQTLVCNFGRLPEVSITPNYIKIAENSSSAAMAFTPSGTHLALLEGDSSALTLVHSTSGDQVWTLRTDTIFKVFSIVFNSVGSQIAIGSQKPMKHPEGRNDISLISLIDAASGVMLWQHQYYVYAHSMHFAFAPNDQILMVQSQVLELMDVSSRAKIDIQSSNSPCNIGHEISDLSQGAWITKQGRRMLSLPDHCKIHRGSRDWASHPHRYIGFDEERLAPFIVDFSCDKCTISHLEL